jgi:stage II sporulation protein D
MIKPRPRRSKYLFGALFALFFLGGKPTQFGLESSFFHGFLIRNPVIRVGLGVNLDTISVGASSSLQIYEVSSGYRLLARDVDRIEIKGKKERLSERFALQVAQTPKKDDAEELARRLEPQVGRPVSVSSGREKGGAEFYQVKLAGFLTHGEALAFIKKLNALGVKEAWILREEVTAERAHALQVMVGEELKTLDADTVIYFIPTDPQSYLFYNGNQYRGIFVLRATPKGLVLINILNLDDYLKGVVPKELSPDRFNAYEALKAQAVAARTYAIKNLGAYGDLGFDVSDTPQSQVYGGLSAEQPMSTRAVEETKGEVATYRGKLIDALYTSTCGGMTEDSENVFEGEAQPYLKSTECTYEKQNEWSLESPALLPIYVSNRNAEREIAVLAGLGIIPAQRVPALYREPVPFAEAVSWIRSALLFLGKKADGFVPQERALNFPGLAELLIEAFQWSDRVKNLMLKSEVDFILRDFPQFKGETREDLAYLIHSGVMFATPELGADSRPISRAELAFVLARAVRSYVDPGHKGVFRKLTKDGIELEENGELRNLSLAPDAFLFRNQDGEVSPASRLTLLGGEEMKWIERQGTISLFEVTYSDEGNVLDRGSPFHHWRVRQSREELEKKINEFYPIGRLVDLTVLARGKSHRATELSIVGTDSQVVVKGLKIRWVLGLRDTLFVLDKEFDERGVVTHFVFCGRGWGHGVGLCQVGAFRMAQAGANYRDILKKYYQDVKVSRYY